MRKFFCFVLLFSGILDYSAAAGAEQIELPRRGVAAHRGASATHPENTLAAFREAIRLGVHQIEFDIQMTKDKRLVLMHDAAVDRTTDGRGRVADLTLEEIRRLDAGRWKAAKFAGERPPTFEEALAMAPINIWLNVHVPRAPNEAELAEAAAREILRQKRTHQTLLAVGHRGADAARRICPEILICNMERQGENVPKYVADAIARRDAFIQLLRQYGVHWPDEIRRLKEAGVRINYCCINEPASLAALYAAGVDFVLTDEVERMLEAARRAGVEPWKPIFRNSVSGPAK